MPISNEAAINIAQEFVQARFPIGSVQFGPPVSVRRVEATAREASNWSVVYERTESADVVSSPGEVIVRIDEQTGRPDLLLTP